MDKKLSKKKVLTQKPVKISPELQAKIDAEYKANYDKHLKEIKERLGDDFKGMYARWFSSDMAMMYEFIRQKHLKEYNKSKDTHKQEEKELR